jgi:4-hydroxy-3-polyprenylbenzoate decarboxylase
MVNRALPGFLKNVYAHPSGGGKLLAVLQVIKRIAPDEGRQRQAALLAFAAFSELKHVILVDDDVDPFDSNDVLWAMTTRFQADADVIAIPGVRCHALDPSQFPGMSPSIRDRGISCKTIFDCTVPVELRQKFQRAQFMDVDYERFLKG